MRKRPLVFVVLGVLKSMFGIVCVSAASFFLLVVWALGGDDLRLFLVLFQLLILGEFFVFGGLGLIKSLPRIREFYLYLFIPFYMCLMGTLFLFRNILKMPEILVLIKFLWPFWWVVFPAFVLIFFNLNWVKNELRR